MESDHLDRMIALEDEESGVTNPPSHIRRTRSFERAETLSFEAPTSTRLSEIPLESFQCTVQGAESNGELVLRTVAASNGEEAIANLESKHIPPHHQHPGTEFKLDVLTKGRYKFHFLDMDVRVERPISKKVDPSLFRSTQPELAMWLREIFQGPDDYEVDQLDGLSRLIFRVKFSSQEFDYVLLSSKAKEGRGVLTCTAVPRKPRDGESVNGYEVSGGTYDPASWNKLVQKMSALEMLRSLQFSITSKKIDPRTL